MKDLIKIKNFCFLKDTVKKMKRQHRLAAYTGKHVSDKGLEYRVCQEFSKLNAKEKTQLKNWQKIWTDIPPEKIYRKWKPQGYTPLYT